MRFWRRFLLKLFGAQLGRVRDVRGSARVWYPPHLHMADRALLAERVICYNMAPISLGAARWSRRARTSARARTTSRLRPSS